MSSLFQRAFATAKRVRNETQIGERPVSVPRVAVRLASKIFEELSDKTALLIGAGEMIELALESLQREGLAAVRIANRTRRNAAALAERFGASAHGFEELDELLAEADVVLSCIGGDGPLLDSDRVAQALRSRHARPVFFIDIGVPRNVDPDVNLLENAYLYDLDDLQDIAASNAEGRRREGDRAEQIVLEEQQSFDGWLSALQAVPTIRDLRFRAEEIRVAAIERTAGRLGLDDMREGQREALEMLTRSIVNNLLHSPLVCLRGESGRGHEEGLAMLEAARSLFGLGEGEAARTDRPIAHDLPERRKARI
jgi:glutamyl-tRNA reductase